MPDPQKKTWLSAHLFYNEPWEEFLKEALAPYIETVLKTGIAEAAFFIRYWEKGPHLRLRFKGEASVLEEVLKPNLIEHFSAYFSANPSERVAPDYPEGFPMEFHWLPNNAIIFENYTAEVNRYGGDRGVELAEQQFHLSSMVILDHFQHQENPEAYHEDLGMAIRLHLGFVHSIGRSIKEAIAFFELIFENWLPSAFELFEEDIPDDEITAKMKETIAVFSEAFEDQKEELITFHKNLWQDLQSDTPFESKVFNKWVKGNRKLNQQLNQAAVSGLLSPRIDDYIMSETLSQKLLEKDKLLWNIQADFVHMSNNRLGILNQDEAYLAYLIKRSLEAVNEELGIRN